MKEGNIPFYDEVINDLLISDVTGEGLEYIIQQTGMRDQMLRQLVLQASDLELQILLHERQMLNAQNGTKQL